MKIREDLYGRTTTYDRFLEAEGLDVITEYDVEDVRTVPLKPWTRCGGKGVYLRLKGAEDSNGASIAEIPAKGSLHPERHILEEMIFIISGFGATELWNEGGKKQMFEWQEGSLFAIPLNAWHQHFNTGDQPVRYLAVTDAPLVIDLFHNMDFVFDNPFVFRDRYSAEEDYFGGKGKLHLDRYWDTNFVPNTYTFELIDYSQRGAGGTNVKFNMANSVMEAHISSYPVGTYKMAHRHGAGAHVLMLSGEGYTLMWNEGEPRQRFNWRKGGLLVPPGMMFHQHFNTGTEPARYLAMRWGSSKWRTGTSPLNNRGIGKARSHSATTGGNQIAYEDEDPDIRKLFEEELSKKGIKIRM